MKKNKKILVTGGAGFVGTNLIKFFLNKTNYNIISIDTILLALKKIILRIKEKYIKGNTKNISKLIKNPKEIKSFFILESLHEFIKVFKK